MIIKVKNKPGFAQIQNTTLRDKRLSLEARGALGEILTYSEAFEAGVENLMSLWDIGRHKLLKITNQLKECGYLEITPVRDKRGRVVDWEWNFYGESQDVNFRETVGDKEPEAVIQNADFPHSGVHQDADFSNVGDNQHLENPHPLLKINSSQKEEQEDLKTHTQNEGDVCEICPVEKSPDPEKVEPPKPEAANGKGTPSAPPPSEPNPASDDYGDFAKTVWAFLETKRLDTPFENPKWELAMDYAFRRKYTAEEFKQTIDHLLTDPEELEWRRGRLTAETVTNNLQKVWNILSKRKQVAPPVDYSQCPDCRGRGLVEVTRGDTSGMIKCRHEQLIQREAATT